MKLERHGNARSYRCQLDRWLQKTMGIQGLPIPHAAPNASPYIERLMRTLRHEALDHFIFLSVDNVRRVVTEFIQYHNSARPSQANHGIPDPYPELMQPPPAAGGDEARPTPRPPSPATRLRNRSPRRKREGIWELVPGIGFLANLEVLPDDVRELLVLSTERQRYADLLGRKQ